MRTVMDWDSYFMGLAYSVADRSKDPNTNVGAVLVDADKDIISTGYNGFATGVSETPQRWERPTKYDYVIHAEVNAICRAARSGKKVNESTLYVTHFPCKNCAKVIIASGVKRIIANQRVATIDPEEFKFVTMMFNEAGIEWSFYGDA